MTAAKTTYTTSSALDRTRISLLCAWIFWPLAIATFVHKVFLVPHNHHVTDDFTTVITALHRFRDGVPVYSEDYSTVDPHYLYSPGGTLLLSPLAWLPNADASRSVYIIANGIAVVLAIAILTKLFRFSLRSGVFPAAIFFTFATEAVQNTLLFSNINGLLLLAEVLFLWLLLTRRQILSGIVLGLAITVKPQFAPLLFLPFIKRQWVNVITGIVVPILFNLAALPLMVSPGDYISKLVPYLGEVRDYANSSISGVGVHFGFPDWSILLWRVLAAAFVIVAIVVLLRWKDRDELMWATTTAGVLLTGVFLVSSLGQMYYSMLLLPMFFTVVRSRSIMHNPVAWVGVYLCTSLDSWFSDRWEVYGRIAEYTRGTVGWSLLVVTAATVAVVWAIMERREGSPALGDVSTYGLFGSKDTTRDSSHALTGSR